ncbi:MAG: NAD(P)-dependent oxidoreductase [Gammaproteobacteria bacterium]|nr:MAG: NAD(P)-dependent oxidoreductase [Gammaproteobacteria bacterium]
MANNFSSTRVAIIGCGWLGTALVQELLKHKIDVIASTTSPTKLKKLASLSIKAEILSLPCEQHLLNKAVFFQQQQLVICIPPQLKYGKTNYQAKISTLVIAAEQAKIKHIILISTTAVYRGLSGLITENTDLNFEDDKVKCLHNTEQAVLNFKGNSSIIRFAGLVGEDRHPGRFLAGKTNLANSKHTVNLIHQQDAVAMIIALLKQTQPCSQTQQIFNGASTTAATRKKFYQQAAKALQLTPPTFNEAENSLGNKIISVKKIQDKLNIKLVYPDLIKWLAE